MKAYAVESNCFIDAVNLGSQCYEAMNRIFSAFNTGKVLLKVSLQTLHELEQKKDAAWDLANTLPVLPHWPIGAWGEQVGPWAQQTGTWDDGKRNDDI